jgi:type II secretory pathway pseudopilin PulG
MRSGRSFELRRADGFAYAILLFALATFSIGLAAAGTAWSEQSRRDKETELLRIGALYAQAIGRYYALSPGTVKIYPKSLTDLLADNRFVGVERHLRMLYSDPVTGGPWQLVRDANGGIRGVHSSSERPPLTKRTIEQNGIVLAPAMRYADWKFIAPEPKL